MQNNCLTPEDPTDPDCTDFILNPDTTILITINALQVYISPVYDLAGVTIGIQVEVSPVGDPNDPIFTRCLHFPINQES